MTDKSTSDRPSDRIDRIDRRMLEELRVDGRLSVTELANRVGLSKTPCQSRLKRLMEKGYIRGFRAIVDQGKLGEAHVAFAEVKLSDTREKALDDFRRAVSRVQEVEECHMIAGNFDYLLKVRTRDIDSYRAILGEKISSLPHVASTSSFVVMETIVDGID
ncbi:PutR, transcriptional activator of PutA and PutP [Altererythrobacter epoxidivorans]|uniref:PutR, transcriptional activator of PutA and PutP n=2 Tax=Altererythrobacter epoxidivorans TaxID=361183 RepID=A0A0M3TAY2_9SPHN|nr:Lrp/AsnC ligand binding domain-containing protein [Altererythrobacter epoxidivorans]ALE17536.1 PutR, transcriptional activator of PutA and PutP [Altererythrobacter epoxidivorans]